ncbi:MAG: PAS domain S-box protein, partial [Anaerolineaceae bacterium]|nr:PAS domain S-box protein [Anaerolineaceae bacterium]
VGDPDRSPDINILNSMKPIASQVSAIYQHSIIVENLRSQIEKDRNGLAVQDAIIENLKEGVIILTPKLTIAGMNQAVEWTLGYANSEVRGMPVENIVIGSERLIQALEIATKGFPTHNLGMASLHRRNGQSFPSRLQVVPVMNQNDVLAIVLFVEDCSEDEQIRARSEQLEHRAVLGEVTAVFAHEVRNPINNISTGLQLLATQLPENEEVQDAIQKMLNDCTRLNHLMESVLSFSRPNELKLEDVDMVEFLRRFMGKWQPRFARVNILPHFQTTQSPLRIFGDPRALEQVFTNLVSNAIDVMSKLGGTLAIHLDLESTNAGVQEVVISVSDNGPGIPDDLCEKIFEPFVTSNPRGTGLGLAITKRIITAHKGSIQVNSFPGGTVFTIRLPAYTGENS